MRALLELMPELRSVNRAKSNKSERTEILSSHPLARVRAGGQSGLCKVERSFHLDGQKTPN